MKNVLKITFLVVAMMLLWQIDSVAQCAMCRAVVEHNVTSGNTKIGAGLNTGILYLMSVPYITFAVLGYLWYKHTQKENANKTKIAGSR
ncbi:hypothetical protein SAMN05421780_107146 [Flexibacter flexilis DSM 6793]|uniref:Uncharacterized protein n=1 Tax=Flexibacter flexilis DSM 6793 TaxID=927664 RepID=A0A1I1KPB9_9BACT|nr:hypothetical protein [Flexibacter flexilis]SFC62445.1 hypothetical protein SAMN05421780_107146 [Flexibacter flexilis DSM 6793]